MSAPASTVLQFNLKVGNDLINVYAESIGEGEELLDALIASGIPQKYHDAVSVLSATNTVAATPAPAVSTPPAAASAPASVPGPAAPAVSTAPDVPVCDHGLPARHVPGGISRKTNRPYPAFYACAQPRESQCSFRANAE